MATTEYEPSPHIETFLRRVKSRNAHQTYKSRKSDLKCFEQWAEREGVNLIEAEPLELEPYFFYLDEEGYASGTINSRYYSLSRFYDFIADKKDLIEESPFENIERSEFSRLMDGTEKEAQTRDKITYVPPEEVEQIADNVSAPRLRNELIVRMMFQTGVREGELVDIRLEDLNRDERSIDVYEEKNQTYRTVYYQPSLDLLLDQWIDEGYRASHNRAPNSEYLFVSDYTPKLEKQRINKIVKWAAQDAGINEVMYEDKGGGKRWKITSHALRHGHAVASLKSDIDVRTVQKHMGHSDISMTMKYLRLIDDDVREAYHNKFGTY